MIERVARAPEPDTPTRGQRTDDTSGSLPGLLAVFARAEFKAPAETIAGLVKLLAEDAHDPEFEPYVDRLRSAAVRLNTIVDGLLDPALTDASLAEGPDTYASVLRHELRTPITAILGYSELLGEEAGDGRAIHVGILDDVIDAARRLLGQIDGMVEFLRLHRHGAEPATQTFLEHAPELRDSIEAIQTAIREGSTERQGPTGRVLVVDDNASTLDLLSRRLRRDGHEVATCEDGEGALAMLEDSAFDLILLDLLMPGMSGIDVLAELKRRPHTAMLPVIMVSALDEVDSAVRCIESGADDYLTKPINPVLLRARMGASLERKFLRDRDHEITQKLVAEQQKSEGLLRNLLPESIVERMRNGETVIADRFAEATVMFADLVGFSHLASKLTPSAVLDLLNGIFSRFDRLAAEYGLEKIKTIGDGYMAAAGLPVPRDDHARASAEMALRMPAEVEAAGRMSGHPLAIRIGLHTGPVAAGIIGQNKFIYDVWGDTVNIASRMEHYGEPGRIHISAATRAALGVPYRAEPRPPLDVKGRGMMATFFLQGRA